MIIYRCYLQNEVISLKMKYLIVSFPLFRRSSSACFGSQLHQRWFCTRVWNGWHFTWETRCKNANPWREWSYFSSVTHCAQLESLSEQLNRHWTILKLDPPGPTATHRPFRLTEPTAWLLVLASGATWALTGSSYFITRTLLSAGCCLFYLASLLRTPEPWDCGTLLHSAADLGKNVNDVLPSPGRAGVLWCDNHYMMSNYYFVNYQQPQGPPGDMTSREAFDSCPKPAFMKNQNWQRRQKNVLN